MLHAGIIRTIRDIPPAHFLLNINSFSLFAKENSTDKYESGIFEAGGYKWCVLFNFPIIKSYNFFDFSLNFFTLFNFHIFGLN